MKFISRVLEVLPEFRGRRYFFEQEIEESYRETLIKYAI